MRNAFVFVMAVSVAVRDRLRQRSTSLKRLQQELSPVFVIGANRSGTSIVSSILSQHPSLEGLFTSTEPGYDDEGHSIGFCESYHVWPSLIPADSERRRNNQWPLWSLPQYVSDTYRARARDNRERFALAWRVERLRESPKQPLIKDNFNILRIGLIKDVFPRARFVLITRRWRSFIERGSHKWTHDGSNTVLRTDLPRVGLHGHLANLIARYDLETYARGEYAEIWLDTLQQGSELAREAFQKVLSTISLPPFEFDLRLIESHRSKHEHNTVAPDDQAFELIREIVDFERQVLWDLEKRAGSRDEKS